MEDLRKEEFKSLSSTSDKLDTRYFQLIFFTLTSFGVIFGFKEKIEPNYIFPLYLYMVLFFTTTTASHAKKIQLKINAYLNKEYYLRDPTIYFSKIYLRDTDSKKGTLNKILKVIKDPFMDFSIIPFAITLFEICKNCGEFQGVKPLIVIIFCRLIQAYIFLRVLEIVRKDLNYCMKELEEKYTNCA